MPNHVQNVLKFHYHKDDGEKIQAIKTYLAGEERVLDFNSIIPQPNGIQDPNPDYLSDAEYEWCKKHWGTKWNAYDVKLRSEGDWKLSINFETAWSWPEPIIAKIMADWPDVNITHVATSEGCCFAIRQVWADGVLEVREWPYSPENAPIIDAIHEALNMDY